MSAHARKALADQLRRWADVAESRDELTLSQLADRMRQWGAILADTARLLDRQRPRAEAHGKLGGPAR